MTPDQAVCLRDALRVGYHLLERKSSALTAVEQTIRVLERSGLFNAGVGSRLQLDGVRRMDASLMEGRELRAGAVASVEGVVHPITVARLVMEETHHVLLVGPPATDFAAHFNVERQSRRPRDCPRREQNAKTALTTGMRRLYRAMAKSGLALRERHGKETVGAVALDYSGTVAAGASTGGIDQMLPGRVGDTPLVGCGCYADDMSGAVSMTGIGEGIIRLAVAKSICERLRQGDGPRAAANWVLKQLVARIHGAAGALVLATDGRFTIAHVTPRMAAGWWDGKGQPTVKDRFR